MDITSKLAPISPVSTSRDWFKWTSIVLAVIGLLIAGYLAQARIFNAAIACNKTPVLNCDAVQRSVYSQVGPIPVVYLGVVGYLLILLVLAFESRVPFLEARGKTIVFGLTLIGVLFSAYLTSIEAFVLHQWCEWCVGNAITMTLLFIVSFARLWRSISAIPLDDEEYNGWTNRAHF